MAAAIHRPFGNRRLRLDQMRFSALICTVEGRVHDFCGPYYCSVDDFMVGPVAKFAEFPSLADDDKWDAAIGRADDEFSKRMHNLCSNNCHHHVAFALQEMGHSSMTMLAAWWFITVHGRYRSWGALFSTYCPFACVVLLVVLLSIFL